MLKTFVLTVITAFLFLPGEVLAQESSVRVVTLEEAKRIVDAAEERAQQDDWTVVIAVVDRGGHLIALRRIDDTQIGSINFAIEKAKSAVYFQRSTKVFEDGVSAGNTRLLALSGSVPFEGGIPIVHEGQVIGGIGVSGVTAAQDGIIAEAGLRALSLNP